MTSKEEGMMQTIARVEMAMAAQYQGVVTIAKSDACRLVNEVKAAKLFAETHREGGRTMTETHELTNDQANELAAKVYADGRNERLQYQLCAMAAELETAIRERDAATKELDAVKRELADAALWNEDSDKTTTPSVQVYVLHQKLIERADDCRDWDRRYEATIKTMGIITRHRNELEALCERQARQLAAQMVQA